MVAPLPQQLDVPSVPQHMEAELLCVAMEFYCIPHLCVDFSIQHGCPLVSSSIVCVEFSIQHGSPLTPYSLVQWPTAC